MAILLNEKVRFQGIFRTLYFPPYITALTAAREQIRFDILGQAIKEAVLGQATPKAALDKAQKQVEDPLVALRPCPAGRPRAAPRSSRAAG
jgi:ABC-type glycerol-3-phosphate transport system substrate-binding protein